MNAAESRQLFNGKDTIGWEHVGPGTFVLEDGMLKTQGGMGLLYYKGEQFENQTVHVVFRTTGPRDNSGIYIRLPEPPTDPWYGVHNGYEVQIDAAGDEWHCTGAIYSLSKATARPQKPVGDWNTLDIQLDGLVTRVFVNGVKVNEYNQSLDVPARKQWYEPVRGPRAAKGYIGIQNHDGGSTIYFKEVSVTPGMTVNANPGFLTQHDRDFALSYYHSTRKQILDAVQGLTPAQWNWKAGPDRWSIAQIVEHITLAEQGLWGFVMAGMKTSTPPPAGGMSDEQLIAGITDRSKKATAPEMFVPKSQGKSGEELTAAFRRVRDAHIQTLLTTQDDFRGHAVNLGGQAASVYQGVLFIPGHTERHLQQLLEVKNSPGFPK